MLENKLVWKSVCFAFFFCVFCVFLTDARLFQGAVVLFRWRVRLALCVWIFLRRKQQKTHPPSPPISLSFPSQCRNDKHRVFALLVLLFCCVGFCWFFRLYAFQTTSKWWMFLVHELGRDWWVFPTFGRCCTPVDFFSFLQSINGASIRLRVTQYATCGSNITLSHACIYLCLLAMYLSLSVYRYLSI